MHAPEVFTALNGLVASVCPGTFTDASDCARRIRDLQSSTVHGRREGATNSTVQEGNVTESEGNATEASGEAEKEKEEKEKEEKEKVGRDLSSLESL